MSDVDRTVNALARGARGVLSRPMALEVGASDEVIADRIARQSWTRLHPGVYGLGAAPVTWEDRLLAAVLAAGAGALVSGRAAVVLWGLDGISTAPVEITVPYAHGPVPAGVIVHRTRRPPEPVVRSGVPVTTVERTILDAAACLPPLVVEKAMESALRRGLTTVAGLEHTLERQGGRGVRGTCALRLLLAQRPPGRAAGSGAEVELLHHLRRHGVPDPVRQHEVDLGRGGVATVDLAWPRLRKAVEVDGVDAHAGAEDLDHDDDRQNRLWDAGWHLRRFSARRVRRHPQEVVASVARFLAA